jgi:hypothetical protein
MSYANRPRPVVVRTFEHEQWDPAALPLFTFPDADKDVRAGKWAAIVRPGLERWPLGVVSEHYRITSHNETRRHVLDAGRTELLATWQSGHGYHVAHEFKIDHLSAVEGEAGIVSSRLFLDHDHTGTGSLRGAMVVFLDGRPLGAVVKSRVLHVSANPAQWSSELDSMVERSVLAQDVLLELVAFASRRLMQTVDLERLASLGIVSKKGKNAENLLDAVRFWFEGNVAATKMTWGVWERRLDDQAIAAMCAFAPVIGRQLDEILLTKRYGAFHAPKAA